MAAAEGEPRSASHNARSTRRWPLPKLHDEDVYATSTVCVRCTIDGLGDMFSRVVAAQVADARSTHSAA